MATIRQKHLNIIYSLDCKEGHIKKNSLCVCLFASGQKNIFFKKPVFPAPDGKKSVFGANKRFYEKNRLLRNPLGASVF